MSIVGTAFAAFVASRVATGAIKSLHGAVIASIGLFILGLISQNALVSLLAARLVAFCLLWGSFAVLQRVSGIYLPLAVILVLLATWLPGLLQEWLVERMT